MKVKLMAPLLILGLGVWGCNNNNNLEQKSQTTVFGGREVLKIEVVENLDSLVLKKSEIHGGRGLNPMAVEISQGIDFSVSGTTAFQSNGLWWTCGYVSMTNNTPNVLSGLLLLAYEPGEGDQIAVRTGNSGTGFDGSGTGYRINQSSNGGWALWITKAASNNIISPGESSDPRLFCVASPTGYSSSIWKLYAGVPSGKLLDRDTGLPLQGWVMLGYSNPDNIRYPELGLGNFVLSDSGGNFAFPELSFPGPHTITAGKDNYANLTVIETAGVNLTLKLKKNVKTFVAVGNYNGTLANVSDYSPAINYSSSCSGCYNSNTCGDGKITAGAFFNPTGYYNIVTEFNLDTAVLVPWQINFIQAFFGNACSGGFLFPLNFQFYSNAVHPNQSELDPSNPLTGLSLFKGEAWSSVTAGQQNARMFGIVGAVPYLTSLPGTALEDFFQLLKYVDFKGIGWSSSSFSTTNGNIKNLALGFYKNYTNTLNISLSNLPQSSPPRQVFGEVIIDVTSNSKDVRLSPQNYSFSDTSLSGIQLKYVSGDNIGSEVNLISLIQVLDAYKRVDTYLQNAQLLHLYRASGLQQTIPDYTISSFFSFIPFQWAGGDGINNLSRKVKFNSGENSNSPAADVNVIVIMKKEKSEPVVEEVASCPSSSCCPEKDAQGRCQYRIEYNKVLWEILADGSRTDITIPDLPDSVDIPVLNPTNYPDGYYPSVYAGQFAWCPGSVLCSTNKNTIDFSLNSDPDPEIIANNATHGTYNFFGLGSPFVITPPNGVTIPGGGIVTISGIAGGGGWDLVQCDSVRIQAVDSNNQTLLDTTVPLNSAGGCGSGLPPYCFTTSFNCSSNTNVSITLTPLNSSSEQCANSTRWSVTCGTF